MALQAEAMVSERTEAARTRIIPTVQLSVIFATGAANTLFPVGTAVAFNTSSSGYVAWLTSGANGTGTIQGFVNPDPVTLSTAGEVAGVIMLQGEIHREEITSIPAQTTLLDTALEALIGRGIIVKGLADVRSV